MQRNEQEMQFADPAWQPVSHGSLDLPASENPWLLPVEVNSPGWEQERQEPQGSRDASLCEQGDQQQEAVLSLGQQQALSQNAGHAGPRRRQQFGIWLLTGMLGIWLLLFLLGALGFLVARIGGSSSSSSASQPPVCANQQSKCP